jgi:hypothetical protein
MSTSFDALAVTSQWLPTLQGQGDPERLDGQRVTKDYFTVLGVRPVLGRDFTADENVRGKHRVTILSYGLWQRRFGGDASIVGKPVTFDGIEYLIVGVMGKDFESLISPGAQLWAPLGYELSLSVGLPHLSPPRRVRSGSKPASPRRRDARARRDLGAPGGAVSDRILRTGHARSCRCRSGSPGA